MATKKPFTSDPWFDSLARAMNIGILLLGSDCEIDYASERAVELFGCERPEELRRGWGELKVSVEDLLRAAPAGNPMARKRDAELDWGVGTRRVRLELYKLHEDECEGCLVVVKDRASLDSLQGDLRLASRFRMLHNLWMGAAHDLKTPLNGMSIAVDLLRHSLPEPEGDRELAQRRERYLDAIGEEADRLHGLVRKLLRQAAPPSDEPRELNVSQSVHELVRMLRPQAERRAIALEARTPEEDFVWVGPFDPIQQALLNLTVNALEAVGEGGRVEVGFEPAGERLLFSVADDGPGIEPRVLERVFDMHFTTKESGSGLGLYVTRQVIESYGGSITVETKPGKGARFRVSFPANQ